MEGSSHFFKCEWVERVGGKGGKVGRGGGGQVEETIVKDIGHGWWICGGGA